MKMLLVSMLGILILNGCSAQEKNKENMDNKKEMNTKAVSNESSSEGMEIATFAGGCFWCTEAVFEEMIGVQKVVSGYSGGHVENPSYEAVCNGETGHAECVQITFDPKKADYKTLVDVFMRTHDPTTKDRQGNDEGTQYRSIIFYQNDAQKAIAEEYIKEKNADNYFGRPIVTEVLPATTFYPAENYHQDYYSNNRNAPYCTYVVAKKVEKFESTFPELTKKEYKNK